MKFIFSNVEFLLFSLLGLTTQQQSLVDRAISEQQRLIHVPATAYPTALDPYHFMNNQDHQSGNTIRNIVQSSSTANQSNYNIITPLLASLFQTFTFLL